MNDPATTTLGDYLSSLRRSWWVIVLTGIVCAGLALVYSEVKTPTYSATARESVHDPLQDLALAGGQGSVSQLPLQAASSHAPDVTRKEVLVRVKRELGLRQPLEQIRSLVTVSVDPNSYAVNITAESSDPDTAATIANAFATTDAHLTTAETRAKYAADAVRLGNKIKILRSTGDPTALALYATRLSAVKGLSATAQPVQISATAQPASSPSSPKPALYTVAAGVIGLLLGMGLAYVRSRRDRRLRSPAEVEEVFDRPILARLRKDVFGHTASLRGAEAAGFGPLDPIDSEAFRMLRENVQYLAVGRDLRTMAVTSAVPEEGKSSVAACLAMANAAAGKRTLLVECDLRTRVLAARFSIAEAPGLSDYLAGRNAPADTLQVIPVPDANLAGNGADPPALVAITAGSVPVRPADVLSSSRFAGFLEQVAKVYERVIIDCPPLLPVADTLEIVPRVDCVLCCVRLNRTTRDHAQAARDALAHLPDRPLGLVITDYARRESDYYHGYYGYREYNGAVPSRGEREREGAAAGTPPGASA